MINGKTPSTPFKDELYVPYPPIKFKKVWKALTPKLVKMPGIKLIMGTKGKA